MMFTKKEIDGDVAKGQKRQKEILQTHNSFLVTNVESYMKHCDFLRHGIWRSSKYSLNSLRFYNAVRSLCLSWSD